jgi:hypothetical protein
MEGDLARTAEHYDLQIEFRDSAVFKEPHLTGETAEHARLLDAADWDGELPAFVLDAPWTIEGCETQAFGGDGWPAFCRELWRRDHTPMDT